MGVPCRILWTVFATLPTPRWNVGLDSSWMGGECCALCAWYAYILVRRPMPIDRTSARAAWSCDTPLRTSNCAMRIHFMLATADVQVSTVLLCTRRDRGGSGYWWWECRRSLACDFGSTTEWPVCIIRRMPFYSYSSTMSLSMSIMPALSIPIAPLRRRILHLCFYSGSQCQCQCQCQFKNKRLFPLCPSLTPTRCSWYQINSSELTLKYHTQTQIHISSGLISQQLSAIAPPSIDLYTRQRHDHLGSPTAQYKLARLAIPTQAIRKRASNFKQSARTQLQALRRPGAGTGQDIMISNRDISTSASMDVASSGATSVDTSTVATDEPAPKASNSGPVSPEDSLPGFLKLSRAGMDRSTREKENVN